MIKKLFLMLVVLSVSLASAERLRIRKLILLLGAKGNLYIKKEEVYLGVGGEILFPLPKNFSLRADFINLEVHEKENSLSFNQESFDVLYNLRFSNPTPYLYAGMEFHTRDSEGRYGLRLGGGLNLKIAPLTRGFGEIGGVLEGNEEIIPHLRLSFGVRYGRR